MRLVVDPTAAAFDVRARARTDGAIAAALALATIITRFPFRSHRVFNWDAVNFVLAMHDYDVRLHHPQPPGYPVFVAMGRVVKW